MEQGYDPYMNTEELLKLAGGGAQPAIPAEPISSTTAQMGPINPPAAPSFSDKLLKGLQTYQVPLMQLGGALMKGRNIETGAPTETLGSQIAGTLAGTASAVKMNEALRKMIQSQLGGGGKGFNEGQSFGLSSADVVGLSPEQIGGLYSTGLSLREKELERPFKNIQAVSDAYLKIMSGEAKPAEIAQHLANAAKTRLEVANMPVNTWLDWQTKSKTLEEIDTKISEMKARTEKMPAEQAKVEAETAKTKAETVGMEPESIYTKAKAKQAGEEAGKIVEIDLGGKKYRIPAKTIGEFAVTAKPETVKETAKFHMEEIKFATNQIVPYLIPLIESDLAKTSTGKKAMDLRELLNALRPIGGGEIDVKVVKALATRIPGLSEKFDRAVGAYIEGRGDEEFKGKVVRSILSAGTTPVAAPAPPPPKGKEGIIQKNITAKAPTLSIEDATKQIQAMPNTAGKQGRFESDTHIVIWDGKKVTSVTPKEKAKPAPAFNYGTY